MQSDYFVLERAGPSSYPLLEWDQSGSAFYKGTPVTVTEPIKLRLGAPVPRNPVMVDHHSLPEPVLSTRIKDALEPLELHGVQLVPADVRVKDEVLRYWLLHVYNELNCLDRQRSACTFYPDGDVLSINTLVLDEAVLRDIPLEKRRVFLLENMVYIFHRTVMDHVMALKPEGLCFFPVSQWSDSAGFKPAP